jgi:hypothetical protein
MQAVYCRHNWVETKFDSNNKCIAWLCTNCLTGAGHPYTKASIVFYIEPGMFVDEIESE